MSDDHLLSKVDDIEMKIDQLLELYIKDRKRLLALPFFAQSEIEKNTATTIPTQTALKPKPILVDKQSSEPTSPVAKTCNEPPPPPISVTRRPMHRGFSDLGNRIKKRVTLRCVNTYNQFPCTVRPTIYQGIQASNYLHFN